MLFKGKSSSEISKSYEGHICRKYGLKYAEFFEGDPDKIYIFILPDTLTPELEAEVKSLKEGIKADNVKYLSIFWLYFSIYFFKELPFEFFTELNIERRPEISRIKRLLFKILKH